MFSTNMFTYTYKAVTKDHKTIESTITGYTAHFVRWRLKKEGLVVIRIERKHAKKKNNTGSLFLNLAQISPYAQILFFRNFSMMLESGISMATTLETLAKQMKGVGVKPAIHAIRLDVTNGKTLSSAMERFPRMFPKHITKTIAVGEQSGALSTTMNSISVDLEKNYELRRKVIGAITYPLIIIAFMFLTALLLVIFVIPQLTNMFNDLGTPIPRMTLWLNVFGSFLITYPVQIIIVVFTLILTFILLLRLLAFRLAVHHILLKIPIFGQLILEYNLVRLTRALTTLVSSGITFTQAIQASKGTLKNEAFRSSLDKIYPVVLHGGTFSDAISMHPKLYPDQLVQLILVGEQSGKLGYSLEKAGLHYERSVQFQTQMLTTVIEPILMLIAGILVGSLAYSMFAPLYGIVEHI